MDALVARNIAYYSHLGQRDRFGDLVVEHLERVAHAVPAEARALAFLHDVLERSETDVEELREHGLTDVEAAALELLTRRPGEPYEVHSLSIAYAEGDAGALARSVKVADLDDHLRHKRAPVHSPPYAWARRHIIVGGARLAM